MDVVVLEFYCVDWHILNIIKVVINMLIDKTVKYGMDFARLLGGDMGNVLNQRTSDALNSPHYYPLLCKEGRIFFLGETRAFVV